MTAVIDREVSTAAWSTMPGWGIFADLTPPELVSARQLRVIRRLIAFGLLVVLALCVAGYMYALKADSDASDEAGAASAATTQLQIQANKYSGVSTIENDVAALKAQVLSVMGTDVDFPQLLAKIRNAAPGTMTIQSLTVSVTAGTAAVAGSLDVSGIPHIGTVSISGVAKSIDDLPTYVDHLSTLPGVVNILPLTNQSSAEKVEFALTFDLNDTLYSHRYDGTKAGK